jgi:hypothetical protein
MVDVRGTLEDLKKKSDEIDSKMRSIFLGLPVNEQILIGHLFDDAVKIAEQMGKLQATGERQ